MTWDFTLQDWVTSGCTTAVGEDGVITCTCNHLTNFAVLVVRTSCFKVLMSSFQKFPTCMHVVFSGYLLEARRL